MELLLSIIDKISLDGETPECISAAKKALSEIDPGLTLHKKAYRNKIRWNKAGKQTNRPVMMWGIRHADTGISFLTDESLERLLKRYVNHKKLSTL